MVWLKRIFNFYLEASIHVALSVYALTFITLTLFDLSYDENSLYIAFYGTILGYNFVKFYPVLKRQRFKFNLKLKLVLFVSFFSGLLLINYALKIQIKLVLFLIIFGLITLLYVFPFKSEKTLRTFPRIKIFVIAIVWSSVALFLPIIQNNVIVDLDVWLTFIQYFLLVIILMLPFEIRDLKYDLPDLKTLPQVIGIKNTKFFGTVLLVIFFLIEFFKDETAVSNQIALFVVGLILFVLLRCSSEKQGKYYSSFFVEAIPVIWLILLLVF
ncbi:hypothetical protein [Aurantibacter sp.]|uniref:hypothetical protein n=1 Tax=Aurantibacter sp. TaxID=2807103 RepID=UPI0035C7C22D